LVLKVSVRPGEICILSSELQQLAAAEGLGISTVAQANGLMAVSVTPATDAVVGLIDRLRTKLKKSGGSVVALLVPDAMHGRLDVWGADPGTFSLMREIKHRFDPGRTLNPGRFVGNI
jgi:glycolate oxidase FAD binding subunit